MSILGENGEELANFSFHIQHLYRMPGNPSDLTIELTITQGINEQTLLIPYKELHQFDIQRAVPGCVYLVPGAKCKVAKEISLSISQALQSPARVGIAYPQSGWYQQPSERIFIAGETAISADGIAAPANAMISKETAQLHLAVDHTLTAGQAAERLLRILIPYADYTIPVFAYTLYSMLHSVWPETGLPTACVLNLIGMQGHGKTTLARILCALYNDSAGHIADFYDAQSTPASIRKALSEARDRIVVVDDICKSTSSREMQKRRDLAAHILRNAANETPVARMSGDTTVSFTCVSGLVLTGELPLEVPSDVTRCVIIDVERPLRNGNPDDRTVAATAAAAYIQWLSAHFDEEIEQLKSSFRTFSDNDTSKKHWRLKKSLFQLDWAFNSFLRFSKKSGAINDDAHHQLEKQTADIFQGIFSHEEALIQRIENSQPSQWRQLIIDGADHNAFPYQLKPGCICVKPGDLAEFFRAALQCPSLQELEIIRKLKAQNLLLMDKTGKATKKVSGVRMLNIKRFN